MLDEFMCIGRNEQLDKINIPFKATCIMFSNKKNIIDGLQTVGHATTRFDDQTSLH